jgi:DNA-binding IclR family transcriptional regulator
MSMKKASRFLRERATLYTMYVHEKSKDHKSSRNLSCSEIANAVGVSRCYMWRILDGLVAEGKVARVAAHRKGITYKLTDAWFNIVGRYENQYAFSTACNTELNIKNKKNTAEAV